MKTLHDETTYRLSDHLCKLAVRSLSRIIGVKNITRPFWNRWRASLIGEQRIKEFLSNIRSVDDWPRAAKEMIDQEVATLIQTIDESMEARIHRLRVLSYLCHMGQWGIMPMSQERIELYRKSRDWYIEAERLAYGERFRRIRIPWRGSCCWGNLHLPLSSQEPHSLIVILHGMDDSKEEHLMTELGLLRAGFAVLCVDGPGQAETLLLEGLTWPGDFHVIASVAIDIANREHDCSAERVGLVGISWGGLWAIKAAAADSRIKAVYDLGGPIGTHRFEFLPYFLKTRFVQTLGEDNPARLKAAAPAFSITNDLILNDVRCAVRIVHGTKDPLIAVEDKIWLRDRLLNLHPEQDVSLVVHPDGDHCCTAQGAEVREDAAKFFCRLLKNATLESVRHENIR